MVLLFALFGCNPSAEKASENTNCETPWTELQKEQPVDLATNGLDATEEDAARSLSADLLQENYSWMVFWKKQQSNEYVVRTKSQEYSFVAEGNNFVWDTDFPLSQDEMLLSSLIEEQHSGENPNNTYIDGHDSTDISFFPPTQTSFPFLAERIAQLFDGTNAPDIGYLIHPYARGGVGSHGGMSVLQSRAPLSFYGPGIRGGKIDAAAKVVDIAPTIAALLGVNPTDGIYKNHLASNLMLKWQDGDVLTQALTDCAYGKAEYAVTIIFDGANHNAVTAALENGDMPNLSKIVNSDAAIFQGGAIVGWPSYSLPGHISIHTGVYQGHHGMYSNQFWDRERQTLAPTDQGLIALLLPSNAQLVIEVMEKYLNPDIETLFEAVARTFPDTETASINELVFRGASWCNFCTSTQQRNLLTYETADQWAIVQAQEMIAEIAPPKYLAISFYLTDGAGERYGPQAELTRQALIDTDERLGGLLALYEEYGIFDQTAFVFTSDHGMELQDTTRVHSANVLDSHPVKRIGQLLYLDDEIE